IANQFTVGAAFSLVNGQLDSIALSYSDTKGIAIGATGLFLTELGGKVEHLTDPSHLSVSGSIGIYGMGPTKINGYSLISASGKLTVDANELKIDGDVSLVGGLLGSGHATIDINWTTGVYSLNASLGLFDGIVNFNGTLFFDSKGDITLS